MQSFNFDDLEITVSRPIVTAGKRIYLELYIKNQSYASILFPNTERRKISGQPQEVLPDNEKLAVGYVNFSYGSAPKDFATREESELIVGSLYKTPDWDIVKIMNTGDDPTWKFAPQKDRWLEPGDYVTVCFEGGKYSELDGLATLFFRLVYCAGGTSTEYRRSLTITKVLEPCIQWFRPKERLYHFGDNITLQWALEKADGCRVYCLGAEIEPTARECTVRIEADMQCSLRVVNAANDEVNRLYYAEVWCIDTFELKAAAASCVTLGWKTFASDVSNVYIKELPGENLGLEGERCFDVDIKKDCVFTLMACQKNSSRIVSQAIQYEIPVLEASAERLCRAKSEDGGQLEKIPAGLEGFLEIDRLMENTNITEYAVTKKSPPQPWPTDNVRFHLGGKNIVSVEIFVGSISKDRYENKAGITDYSPIIWIPTSDNEALVRASDMYGYVVEKTVTF